MTRKEYKDRVLKTFIESFLATLLPDIGIIVNQILEKREVWWAVLLPFVASALGVAISAALNGGKVTEGNNDDGEKQTIIGRPGEEDEE